LFIPDEDSAQLCAAKPNVEQGDKRHPDERDSDDSKPDSHSHMGPRRPNCNPNENNPRKNQAKYHRHCSTVPYSG